MTRPIAFATCYMLGALILAAFFLLDGIYFRSFFANWHIVAVLVFPLYWFTYRKKVDLPECAIKLLVVFLVFFSSVHVFLSVFFPDFTDHSWPEATARSIVILTSAEITFLVVRHFNQTTLERES